MFPNSKHIFEIRFRSVHDGLHEAFGICNTLGISYKGQPLPQIGALAVDGTKKPQIKS